MVAVLQAFWKENTGVISGDMKCYSHQLLPTATIVGVLSKTLSYFQIYQLQELCCQPISYLLTWCLLTMWETTLEVNYQLTSPFLNGNIPLFKLT